MNAVGERIIVDSPPRRRFGITMGDPAGIGPEICLKALADSRVQGVGRLEVYGDTDVLEQTAASVGLPFDRKSVVDVRGMRGADVKPGQVDAACGRAAYVYIERALDDALAGQLAGVVTAPINKESLRLAGVDFPGHTEIFAARTGAERACMMQISDVLTVSFVTTHVSAREAADRVTRERVLDVIELTAEALRRIRGREPVLCVLGLNPHAGEHGLFGDEEEAHIVPAIESAQQAGLDVTGPIPPDTAFLADRRTVTDAFVCMTHDQGHIPLKMLAFDKAVNVTLGLPIVRTSVDHGTAFDIVGQNRANPESLIQAILLANRLTGGI